MRKIIYVGQLHDNSGYGVAARTNLLAINKVKEKYSNQFDIKAFSLSFENRSSIENEPEFKEIKHLLINGDEAARLILEESGQYEVVLHLPIPAAYLSHTRPDEGWKFIKRFFENSKYNHNISAWESDKVPSSWINMAEKLNIKNFATPSTWNSEVYLDSLNLESVHTIPHVVECTPEVSLQEFSFEEHLKDSFKLISISQWQPRKDFETLIRAFYAALHDKEDALLIIKSYRNLMDSEDSNRKESADLMRQITNIRNSIFIENGAEAKCKTLFIGGVIEKEKLNRLISISDAYITCTRGEGFGLPISEAMALEKPVIVPDQTGHMDFVTEDNFLIKGHWDIAHSIPGYPSDSNFYYSHINSAASQIKKCYNMFKEEREKLRKIGVNNKKSISSANYDLVSVGESFFEFLNKGQN